MGDDQYNIDDDSEDQDADSMQDYGNQGQGQTYMQPPDDRYRPGGYQQMQYSGGNQSNNYGRGGQMNRFGGANGNGYADNHQ